jgi:hypothetical protein
MKIVINIDELRGQTWDETCDPTILLAAQAARTVSTRRILHFAYLEPAIPRILVTQRECSFSKLQIKSGKPVMNLLMYRAVIGDQTEELRSEYAVGIERATTNGSYSVP